MVNRSGTDRSGVFGRLSLRLALAGTCAAMALIPGDAAGYNRPLASAATGASQTPLLLSDMSQPSQQMPAGVPSWYDWAEHPRVNPITSGMRKFRAFTAWGQLYQCAGERETPRAAVELRDLQAWVLLRNSRNWRLIQFSSDLGGAAFAEDYAGPTVAGRYSASNSGTSAQLIAGHNFHFWPSAGRVSLNASDVVAVTVAMQARLDPARDMSPKPCFVLSVGGDLWRSLSTPAGGSSSGDVGIGRFKLVERNWRLFTMTTASPLALRQDPLPSLAPVADDF